ncbi:MAG: hypothetical protein QOH60_2985 [Mycobacterium sp.]|jgi:uncharacterized membrane protein|nr:hypothetical protein [Xanthomonadaceae bacterium]MDT5093622.1 hypothetical protein [Mycobacterium sp.]
MRRIRAFGAFWYNFVIGDDWQVALIVALALAGTFAVNHVTGASTWWIVVVAVAAALPLSIYRATRAKT